MPTLQQRSSLGHHRRQLLQLAGGIEGARARDQLGQAESEEFIKEVALQVGALPLPVATRLS